ncbi:MAG TPA: hypothetical protein VMB50_17020 [Myxococcales bacterium]|nr:hypothetical protein [Myxococcales bacterium]
MRNRLATVAVLFLAAACSSTSGADAGGSTAGPGTSGASSTGGRGSSGSTGGSTTSSTGSVATGGSTGGTATGGTSSTGGIAACVEGAGCVPSAAPTDVGLCCAGVCRDIQADPANCGGCGDGCPSGTTCQYGFCSLPSCAGAATNDYCALADGGNGQCCNGACFDPGDFNSDPANCGACGDGCAAGSACASQACALADGGSGFCAQDSDCPAGQSCSVQGACARTSCGDAGAGTVCNLPATATDAQGVCCGGACSDSSWDDANCGGCGLACPSGSECLYGTCQATPSCGPSDWGTACQPTPGVGGSCCGSTCSDLTTDSQNCGYCGGGCPTGSTCTGGVCVYTDGGFASCAPPAIGCPAGTLCGDFGGLCSPATCGSSFGFCFLGIESAPGLCCGGHCVDALEDPANCGACGASCDGGVCTSPEIASTTSGGACVPAATGSCAGGCPSGQSCAAGVCLETSCDDYETAFCALGDGGAGACCLNFFTGVTSCADVTHDPANCGGCQVACPTGQTCENGVCSGTVAPCSAANQFDGCALTDGGFGLCCPGGGCSDPNSDPQNCGYCGNPCGAGSACVAGNCQ